MVFDFFLFMKSLWVIQPGLLSFVYTSKVALHTGKGAHTILGVCTVSVCSSFFICFSLFVKSVVVIAGAKRWRA